MQDAATFQVKDEAIAAWLEACQPVTGRPAPILLLTSRWVIPGWEREGRQHYPLPAPSYGDFLRYHQQLASARWELSRLRRVYQALDGNFKGLELFHGLSQVAADEEAFLQQLEQAQTGLQVYMAVAKLFGYLQPAEQELLNRLRAYQAPVIIDGVRLIAEDARQTEPLLKRLTGLSLVEVEWETDLAMTRYRLSLVVTDWLTEQREAPDLAIRHQAARYQVWVFENLLDSVDQLLIAHEALRRAELDEEAARLALDYVAPNFDRWGLYHTLLKEWLPVLRESQDPMLKARVLNWSGTASLHIGDHKNAMRYLQEALAISRAIGDRAGLCTTLFSIEYIHFAKQEREQGIASFVAAYRIAKEIGYAEALQNLDNLAKQLGGNGLETLEMLAQQLPAGGDSQ